MKTEIKVRYISNPQNVMKILEKSNKLLNNFDIITLEDNSSSAFHLCNFLYNLRAPDMNEKMY